jgi:hypothetical protein
VTRARIALGALLLVATPRTSPAQTQLVIVSGLGGEPKYTQSFGLLSAALAKAAKERGGIPDSAITWLGEANAAMSPWYRGPSRRENIERTLAALAARPDSTAQTVLVLIGHGSGDGPETRISLPGADLTAADFAKLLSRFGGRRVAFINLTSASGDMLPVLAGPNRVIMTATKSAFERNESQFARFFVDAFARDGADIDKDSRVSLLEAFRYADAETKRFYESQGRLATEHAQMADDGQLARRFFLASGASMRGSSNPRLAVLYGDRSSLDERIQALKKRKAGMSPEAYERELEDLLLTLARNAREIRKLEAGGI